MSAMPVSAPHLSFAWLTAPAEPVELSAVQRPPALRDHDQAFHTQMAVEPRLFCAPSVSVDVLAVRGQSVALAWVEVPYCCVQGGRYRSLGWNFALTVDDGTRVVTTTRHPSLAQGGLRHLSTTEGAEPGDMPPTTTRPARVDIAPIAARALREELGLAVDAAAVAGVVSVRGVFAVGDSGVGVFVHVAGERLGWTGDQVLSAHRGAPDGWEGVPEISDLSVEALGALSPPDGWTPWGWPCLAALCTPA